MAFGSVPCPMLYVPYLKKNPSLFVEYCQAFIKKNDTGRKAIGVKSIPGGPVMILTMPDYDAKRPIVKGRGKTKTVTYEDMYKVPIEAFLSKDDFEYLEKKGMDKYGRKLKKK
ncbi:hypothetical protein BpsM61_00026 [Bacillus phage vB_BpsM-61]|nr:hypothetical protein BpsM61_00026 [Bacillus phage vB_BpsM-61]